MMWLQDRPLSEELRSFERWPRDKGSHEDPEYEYCGDEQGGRFWCIVGQLGRASAALKLIAPAWCSMRLDAMLASLHVLEGQGSEVRVLFYKM
jgi:hypothetical protein